MKTAVPASERAAGAATVASSALAQGARSVDVNEQNPQALGFYLRLGFVRHGRSPVDGSGKPFPILHLRLA